MSEISTHRCVNVWSLINTHSLTLKGMVLTLDIIIMTRCIAPSPHPLLHLAEYSLTIKPCNHTLNQLLFGLLPEHMTSIYWRTCVHLSHVTIHPSYTPYEGLIWAHQKSRKLDGRQSLFVKTRKIKHFSQLDVIFASSKLHPCSPPQMAYFWSDSF